MSYPSGIAGENVGPVALRNLEREVRRLTRGFRDPNPGSARIQDAPAVMAVTPTFTLGTVGAAPTIASPQIIPYNSSIPRILGGRARAVTALGADYYANGVNTHSDGVSIATSTRWFKEFCFDGQAFETGIRGGAGTSCLLRVWVDGKPSHAAMQSIATTSNNSRYYLNIDFGSRAIRHVMIEVSLATLGDLVIGPSATVWAPTHRPAGPRVIVMGDSIAGGALSVDTHSTWVAKLGQLMGWRDVWNASEGGTGLIANGMTGYTNFVNRAPLDVTPWHPDIVIMAGGRNDSGATQADVVTALRSVIGGVRAGNPDTKIICLTGIGWSSGSPSAAIVQTRDAIIAGSVGLADLVIDTIGGPYPYSGNIANYVNTGWITGTGRSDAPTGSGNADLYIGTDNVHPTQLGADYYGFRVAQAIAAAIPL